VVAARDLPRAYAYCLRLAHQHYENFPVASWLLPAAMRPHVAAVYAFARLADDLADEGRLDPDARLARLAEWRRRLWACAEERPDPAGPTHSEVFVALGHTIRSCGLPPQLLDDLLSAFVQDVTQTRYATWAEVLDYCRRSANPVGRLVLRIAGCRDPEADLASDAICTALQLTNFWQDLAVDWSRGRIYVPADVCEHHGAPLACFDPASLTDAWIAALRDCGSRTRALFLAGRGVCDAVEGRLRWELRLTWLGGMRILDRVERARFDMVRRRPALGAGDALPLLLRLARWPRVTAGGATPTA
jgi:phytoene synthase